MAEEFRVLRPYEYHSQLVLKGRRADGRSLQEFREIKLETDAIRTADASSLVKLGNTSLVCGCTSQIVKARESSEEGDEIKIRVELPPICSSPYGNRTQNTAQLLTKTLKNILDDTGCIDRQNFRIDDDNHWSIDVEVICLNYDGCVLDAALIAVLSALKSLKLNDKDHENSERSVKFNTLPITTSFAMIGDKTICDPNLEEESIAQSTFSITVDSRESKSNFHVTKIGGKPISSAALMDCVHLAGQRAVGIHNIIDDTRSFKGMDTS